MMETTRNRSSVLARFLRIATRNLARPNCPEEDRAGALQLIDDVAGELEAHADGTLADFTGARVDITAAGRTALDEESSKSVNNANVPKFNLINGDQPS